MVNINVQLPPAIAAAFHPPTEGLQSDNLLKPEIPKTELITPYPKERDDPTRKRYTKDEREIFQDENYQANKNNLEEKKEHNKDSSNAQKRFRFFAQKKLFKKGTITDEIQIISPFDFKIALTVIERKYQNAVRPYPAPKVLVAI